MSGAAKRGRPHKPYRASWGEHINGLRRRKDGRWVIVETGKTFIEADERRAVVRFRRWQRETEGSSVVRLLVPFEMFESRRAITEAFHSGSQIVGRKDGSTNIATNVPEATLWAWFREQLIQRPEFVAKQIGIPEVARLANLPTPQRSPTLKAIGQLYQDKSEAKKIQRRQVRLFWSHFEQWLANRNITTLRKLTPAVVAEYGDEMKAEAKSKPPGGGGSAKYMKNRFMSIRGVINFARKRGEHAADVRHALDCCAVLQPPKRINSKDPHPISKADFHTLLDNASDPRMQALLLVMLNLCMYPSEALALDWDEIDLVKRTVVTDRSKTSVIRIGVLWPRTVNALTALKPRTATGDLPVFLSREGQRWSGKTVNTLYRRLRKAADVSESTKCEDCRDGAYTTAIESGADLTQAKLLAGHATGISDHYAKRKPTMVADAVNAIEQEYFG